MISKIKTSLRATGLLVLFLSLSLILWMGCSEEQSSPNAPESPEQIKPIGQDDPLIERAMKLQDLHTPELLASPDVVGTGTGVDANGQPAIFVFTKSKTLAKPRAIPAKIEDFPVVIKVTGEFKAEVDPASRFPRPVPIGVSTGNFNQCSAGTIACRVVDGDGYVFALSNNHVYALTNIAPAHSLILQPGRIDGTPICDKDRNDVIGKLGPVAPIKFDGSFNTIDAALAQTNTDWVGNATPADGYGTPQSTTKTASIGMKVKKYGRTTSLTNGTVAFVNVAVAVNYGAPFGIAFFKDQIIVISKTEWSAPGDSGSLVVTKSGNFPVGLHFAGANLEDGDLGVENPIDAVLSFFGVNIDGL